MPKGNCEFNGSGRDYLGLFVIHLFLLSILTLGIYSPWAWVRLFKLKASHTVINGKPVTFTGSGKELLILGLVNGLLTIITLGIYGPWAICRISKWKAQKTLVDGKPSDFVGTGLRLFLFYLIHFIILPILTLGIYYFYGLYRFYAWKEERMRYGGQRTSFGAGFWDLLKIFFAFSSVWVIFPVISQYIELPSIDLLAPIFFILLSPWLMCMFFRWQIKGLVVGDEEGVEHFPPVKTSFRLILMHMLIALLAIGAAGLLLKDQFERQMTEMAKLTQMFEMKERSPEKIGAIRVPVKRPSHAITPKHGTRALPKKVLPKKTPAPKLAKKHLPKKPTSKKPHVPVLSSPHEKQVLESKDYDREISEFDELIRRDRQNADLYYSRGCLYEQKGALDKARKDFTKSIDINNRVSDTYYNRGLVLVRMKKYALAIKDFDKAIELDSRAVDAYCNRGSANYQLGKSDLAIRDYNEGLKLNPKDGDLFYNRGVVNLSKGRNTKAKADFKKATMLGHRLASEMISKQK